jgi:RNA polymerase sigma-70 factor (ECF subfamily)
MTDPVKQIYDYVEENAESLARTLRGYVIRAGLARGEAVPEAAIEVLQETVVEALRSAHRFDPSGRPAAWLLGIAANVIKRRQVKQAVRHKYEVPVRDAARSRNEDSSSEMRSDSELFDRLASLTVKRGITPLHTKHRPVLLARDDVEQNFDSKEVVEAMLARLSPEDQAVVRLAVLEGLEGDAVAIRLGIKPGAARVRLHRALKRLRKIMEEQQGGGTEL